jgi:hypothetical protein
VLANAERPIAALSEVARTLRVGGRLVLIEEFDALAAHGGNPIATLRAWLTQAGFEGLRVHPVDTASEHLLVAIAQRRSHGAAAA